MPVHILAIGTALPFNTITAPEFDQALSRFAIPSPALKKTQYVNNRTEIHTRRTVQSVESGILSLPEPPSIDVVNSTYMDLGVKLAVEASRNALEDWGGKVKDVTHLISTTCTSNSYPGFDHYLGAELKLSPSTNKTLISGVGCSGGLAILRLAKSICDGDANARVLVVACEVTSSLMRTEIQSMDESGMPNIPVTLFADGCSALIIGAEPRSNEESSFEIVRTEVETIPDSPDELAFMIHPQGWRAIITPKVPVLIATNLPQLVRRFLPRRADPEKWDWLIHPGGAAIMSAVEKGLGLDKNDHSRASWEVYHERGNMSSASIGHVIEVARRVGGREDAIAVAFGPGINVEIAHLRRPPTKTYSLARERYIEMHEQSWCPPGIREAVQRMLMMMWTTRMWPIQQRAPVDCVVEVLEEVIGELEGGKGDKAEELTVVDFCSGDGGPMKKVSSILTQRRQLANAKPLPFILTDLYPPSRLPSSPSTSFTYHPDPVDATAPPKSLLQGVGKHIRTFALAFHHFPEKEAKEVLQAGMIESDAFCIFEMQEFNLVSWLIITLMGPLTLLLTPVTQPSLYTLFFTYVVPIIPFIAVIDGYVSSIRTRDIKHMRYLINQAASSSNLIDLGEWEWEEGRKKHMPMGAMWYLKGVRTRPKQTNGKH